MTNKEGLINAILQVCKVSDIQTSKCPVTGELVLDLAGLDESALKKIAQTLYINVDQICDKGSE